jgi:D-alanine-D-alanine ligase
MDKTIMKVLFRHRGLRVTDWITVHRRDWRASHKTVSAAVDEALRYPLFVKPASLGSSVGISRVASPGELAAAIDRAAAFDRKILVEEAVADAREIECAVLGNGAAEASVPGEIVPSREFYDYEAKYLDNQSRVEVPAALDPAQTLEVRRQALTAFEAIDGAGLARVDFLIDGSTGDLYLNEINTLPGFTTISMYPKLWGASGLSYPVLMERLITLALERHADRQESKTSAF